MLGMKKMYTSWGTQGISSVKSIWHLKGQRPFIKKPKASKRNQRPQQSSTLARLYGSGQYLVQFCFLLWTKRHSRFLVGSKQYGYWKKRKFSKWPSLRKYALLLKFLKFIPFVWNLLYFLNPLVPNWWDTNAVPLRSLKLNVM